MFVQCMATLLVSMPQFSNLSQHRDVTTTVEELCQVTDWIQISVSEICYSLWPSKL